MKERKMEKGITLVALIITIIVLLILAVVSIRTVQDDGIIAHAKNARDQYEQKAAEENALLSNLTDYMIGQVGNEAIGKATVGTIVNKKSTINGKAYSSTNPVIPAGFKAINTESSAWDAVGGPEVNKGLVISDGTSEFVWIPVESISAMAVATSGKDANGRTNYRGVLYHFSTDATGNTEFVADSTVLREPANISDSTSLMPIWTETLYQESFNKMVESVRKYKGFYVGRYETSLNGATAQSKAGETPMTNINWYRMYENSKTYSSSNTNLGVESEMIWGCQWDAMLRYILTTVDASHVTATTNVGHNTGSDVSIPSYKTGGIDYNQSVTYNDKAVNIYDLEGNIWEWTQEDGDTAHRTIRGGHCNYSYSPSYREYDEGYAEHTYGYVGSRLSLYIK